MTDVELLEVEAEQLAVTRFAGTDSLEGAVELIAALHTYLFSVLQGHYPHVTIEGALMKGYTITLTDQEQQN